MHGVKIATGTVVEGRVVVEGQPFAEGEKVTVVGNDEETFTVTAEEKRFLLESMAQADRGELVDMDELLTELDESN
jgi:redox-sensitive bicupin YhaK (pirin superfamily)